MQKEVFRTGTWTDSAGRTRKFVEKDIDKIVSLFDEKTGRNSQGRNVPLFVGHPTGASRAYGWVKKVWRDGKKMFAEFKEIPEKAKKGLENSVFKDVSISLDSIKGHILEHVGLTNMPAVAGMDGFEFEAFSESVEYTSIDEDDRLVETLYQKLLSKFKTKKGDHTMTEREETLTRENADLTSANTELKTHFEKAGTELEETKTELTAANEGKEKAEKELKEFKEADAKRNLEIQDNSDMAWCDQQITDKKILPRDKKATLFMLKNLRAAEEKMEFGEGDEKKEKTAMDLYKSGIESRGEVTDDSALGEGEDRKADRLEAAALKYQQENPEADYSTATDKVLEANPELEKGA